MSSRSQASARNDRHTSPGERSGQSPTLHFSGGPALPNGGTTPSLARHASVLATPPAWSSSMRQRSPACSRAAFTLLEVLVSIVILTLLVIACASLYAQTANAWESGLERTESTLIGRTLCGFIARELEQAVPEDAEAGFDFQLAPGGGSTITFVKLVDSTADESAARRAAIRVRYAYGASTDLGAVTRAMQTTTDEQYPANFGPSTPQAIGAFIAAVEFLPPDGWTPADGLPRYVDVYLDVVSPEDYEKNQLSGGVYDYSDQIQTYQVRAQLRNKRRSSW